MFKIPYLNTPDIWYGTAILCLRFHIWIPLISDTALQSWPECSGGLSIENVSYKGHVFSPFSRLQEITWPVERLWGYTINIITPGQYIRNQGLQNSVSLMLRVKPTSEQDHHTHRGRAHQCKVCWLAKLQNGSLAVESLSTLWEQNPYCRHTATLHQQ